MFEKLLAGTVLAVCLVLLLRMLMGERRRQRMDAALRPLQQRLRSWAHSLRQRRARPQPDAARVAEEAIERARRGSWNGNVYTPKSFKRPTKH
ncbi:hypothetical protein [Eleftheria terrae]|uniref:hypothetical protein n=1 Tax=Eleftheria terrae TaxID=1597781 RepID=UPI00263AE695|nr:hypothetical protein [Eleftheria terrae]WKB51441.1 hypothetical protein N7L95_16725 [Eleftheria terrae]